MNATGALTSTVHHKVHSGEHVSNNFLFYSDHPCYVQANSKWCHPGVPLSETLPWRGQLSIQNGRPATIPNQCLHWSMNVNKAHVSWDTWPAHMEQWWVGKIMVGGGLGHRWGHLGRRGQDRRWCYHGKPFLGEGNSHSEVIYGSYPLHNIHVTSPCHLELSPHKR